MQIIERISKDFPVGNAAGWCKSVTEVERLAWSAAQFILVGSITVPYSPGNSGNTFNGINLNSLGLPNGGLDDTHQVGSQMVRLAHANCKPIIMSGAAKEAGEVKELATAALEMGFDGYEDNAGCPNVVDGGKRKPIPSFDLNLLKERMEVCAAMKALNPNFFFSVKVSPMSNPLQIINTAELLAVSDIDSVVTMNTFPNALLFNEDGTPQIQTPDGTGWAGLSGPEVKAAALGQVNQWRKALDEFGAERILVTGVGGVGSGRDVLDMQRAGAALVQVGTAYFTGGAKVFSEIAGEFIDL